MAVGVMTLVLGVGALRALTETRAIYYERYEFADLFANVTRAPNSVVDRIAAISGVAVAEGRIFRSAVLDIDGLEEPASGFVLSLPDRSEALLNRLFLVAGHLPGTTNRSEVVISGAFAEANRLEPGDTLSATIGGNKRTLAITGVVLSPEFIYSVAPGDIIPDDRRFGVIWMRYAAAAASYDMSGAFNAISVKLAAGANEIDVIDRIDAILDPYGGTGAFGRSLQSSHAYLQSEISALTAMNFILPPMFLAIAAFLVNMTLARLIALEREQIGLLKALGYTSGAVAWHYMKLSILIAFAGIIIGWIAGAVLSRGMAAVYAEFFKFPFLFFQDRPDVFAISGAAALLAAVLGSIQAVRATLSLSAAVAMAPPAPPRYRRFILDRWGISKIMPQGLTMALRNMVRTPVRALLTVLGVSLSTALLVAGLFTGDSMDHLIDVTFFQADRQQASLAFATPVDAGGLASVGRLAGVMAVEPTRALAVTYRFGPRSKQSALIGKLETTDLSRVIDVNLEPVRLPEYGVALSEMLAEILGVQVGDTIEVDIRDGRQRTLTLPVSQIIKQFMGLAGYMEITALNRALGEGAVANGADLMFDTRQTSSLYQTVKQTPAIASLTLQRSTLASFRATMGESLGISRLVYVVLAVIIVFGVVYNSMRIQLSERARELASLRVLGFTRGEVSGILFTELGLLTLVAIPLGCVLGYWLAFGMAEGMKSELFRFPVVVFRSTYVSAALVVLAATVGSALVVKRRVDRLDMVEVLKTRD
ncbi:MAG: ABC transporter permease [Alphaproteobacteria bacterium]|nr:ABC transporter permease [Alphaproteobacteria bacterium]